MLFNSYVFILMFLPLVVVVYWTALRYGTAPAICWLCAASYFFYVHGEKHHWWIVLVSILANFLFGKIIHRLHDAKRKQLFAASIAFNLLLLLYFKYSNFLIEQLEAARLLPVLNWNVILPLGISFYTFTQIAYLADVYEGKATENRATPYFLFVTFFPHLVAGPILHHKEMMPQFHRPRQRRMWVDLYAGLAMFAIGLAKKLFIADPMGQVATGIFDHRPVGFFVSWIGAIAYTLQIYFDFSGYSDMAIGSAQMLGIKLPINFNSPYKAVSIIDFWRRWHITLSRFLRDYLYIPLGGNRKGEGRRYINILTTMVLGGIWHGAGWTFLVWGALHGTALALAHGWRDVSCKARLPSIPPLLGWLATIVFVIVAWVPFRTPTLGEALSMWKSMAGLNGLALPALGPLLPIITHLGLPVEAIEFNVPTLILMTFSIVIALLAPNSQQLTLRFRLGFDSPGYEAFGRPTRILLSTGWGSVLYIAVLLGISLRSIGSYSEFIYFRF